MSVLLSCVVSKLASLSRCYHGWNQDVSCSSMFTTFFNLLTHLFSNTYTRFHRLHRVISHYLKLMSVTKVLIKRKSLTYIQIVLAWICKIHLTWIVPSEFLRYFLMNSLYIFQIKFIFFFLRGFKSHLKYYQYHQSTLLAFVLMILVEVHR